MIRKMIAAMWLGTVAAALACLVWNELPSAIGSLLPILVPILIAVTAVVGVGWLTVWSIGVFFDQPSLRLSDDELARRQEDGVCVHPDCDCYGWPYCYTHQRR